MSIALSHPISPMRIAPVTFTYKDWEHEHFVAAREADKDYVLEYARGDLEAVEGTFWTVTLLCRVSIAEAYELCATSLTGAGLWDRGTRLALFEKVVLMRADAELRAGEDASVKTFLGKWDAYREKRAAEYAEARRRLVLEGGAA